MLLLLGLPVRSLGELLVVMHLDSGVWSQDVHTILIGQRVARIKYIYHEKKELHGAVHGYMYYIPVFCVTITNAGDI